MYPHALAALFFLPLFAPSIYSNDDILYAIVMMHTVLPDLIATG